MSPLLRKRACVKQYNKVVYCFHLQRRYTSVLARPSLRRNQLLQLHDLRLLLRRQHGHLFVRHGHDLLQERLLRGGVLRRWRCLLLLRCLLPLCSVLCLLRWLRLWLVLWLLPWLLVYGCCCPAAAVQWT